MQLFAFSPAAACLLLTAVSIADAEALSPLLQVRVYDLASYHEVPRLCISEGAGIMSLSLADDNRHLLLNMTDQQIHLWQVNPDSAQQPTSPGQRCGVLGPYFCPFACRPCRIRETVGAVGAFGAGLALGWQQRGPSPACRTMQACWLGCMLLACSAGRSVGS